MEFYKILTNLIENPLVPRFYREIRDYYINAGKTNEATAFSNLIESKFSEKNDPVNDSSDNSQ